jgi:hypothetical protein
MLGRGKEAANMAKLFVMVVGGYPPGSNLEVHDTRFHVAERVEDTFETLKKEWWGGEDRFHLDAYGTLEWADGHEVVVASTPPEGASGKKLYFIHLGGYQRGYFGELHREVFVAAKDKAEAKRRALAAAEDWDTGHRDVLAEVEAATEVVPKKVFLVPSEEEKPFEFVAKYMPFKD